MRCLVGIDDTDSQFGHCTTYLGYRIVSRLMAEGCSFNSYPRLVRLNPNVPFKTRGNAAVSVEFECDDPWRATSAVRSLVEEEADVKNGANAGVVFLTGSPHPFFRDIYREAVSCVVGYRRVLRALSERGISHFTLGNGMGAVGAAASLGFDPEDDHTYELLAYRRPENCGRPRLVDEESVRRMELATSPHTFNSYDFANRRVLITPHGPDPVFLGIRADSPRAALDAFGRVSCGEPLLGHMVYLSNQCTDAHLERRLELPLAAYHSGWLEGLVEAVSMGRGGHLYFELETGSGTVRCAVYEPSGDMRRAASLLAPGDRLKVFGGVRRPSSKQQETVNVEKFQVLSVSEITATSNPLCENCGRRMKSEGKDKGFQCRRCGARSARDRSSILVERDLVPGLFAPSAGSQRHLTKQLIRYGREEHGASQPLAEGWLKEEGAPQGASRNGGREGSAETPFEQRRVRA